MKKKDFFDKKVEKETKYFFWSFKMDEKKYLVKTCKFCGTTCDVSQNCGCNGWYAVPTFHPN